MTVNSSITDYRGVTIKYRDVLLQKESLPSDKSTSTASVFLLAFVSFKCIRKLIVCSNPTTRKDAIAANMLAI